MSLAQTLSHHTHLADGNTSVSAALHIKTDLVKEMWAVSKSFTVEGDEEGSVNLQVNGWKCKRLSAKLDRASLFRFPDQG